MDQFLSYRNSRVMPDSALMEDDKHHADAHDHGFEDDEDEDDDFAGSNGGDLHGSGAVAASAAAAGADSITVAAAGDGPAAALGTSDKAKSKLMKSLSSSTKSGAISGRVLAKKFQVLFSFGIIEERVAGSPVC